MRSLGSGCTSFTASCVYMSRFGACTWGTSSWLLSWGLADCPHALRDPNTFWGSGVSSELCHRFPLQPWAYRLVWAGPD